MSKLRILHLEDDRNDAELVHSAISGEGIEFDAKVVDKREDFTAALEGGIFDLILADYSLPGFDGLSALEIAREKRPDLPFIFVSGALGEDLAVETLKKGGTDFVLKNRLSRLVPSVNRALRESGAIQRRKEAEEALRHSEERYRSLFEAVRDIVYTVSKDGVVTSLNSAFEAETGFSRDEWVGKNFDELIHPDDLSYSLDLFRRSLNGERLPVFELRILTKRGEYKVMEFAVSQRTIGGEFVISGIARDITEQKKIESFIERAKRMESMGRLAGGIAHDFNNILTIIMGYANSLQMKIDKNSPWQSDLEQISISVKKGAELTKSLLVLGKKQEISLKEVDLNEVIKTAENLFLKFLKKDVELRMNLTTDKLAVMADVGQIENVLINLAMNAGDAMPRGGKLSIESRGVGPDLLFIKALGHKNSGRYALISISDTGTGMDEGTKMRIFEPFFTTKEADKGTGLGLSMVYGTIKQHNGYIDVQSEAGKGTTFNIYLPMTGSEVV